jgi:hypothetical protein
LLPVGVHTDVALPGIFVLALEVIACWSVVRIAERILVPWHGKA